ncbi:CBS domain-containing protein [Streptomyces sp. NPDC047097]|uniref:CBS domain-containing protein n=1 Tax=Streptomyces sp. NPDC047097 TaxID=3155260 RepID=UPI0033E2413D
MDAVDDRPRTVGEVMSAEVVQAGPGTPFEELARLLTAHRISGVPVVDDDDKVVGVVSRTDLTRGRTARNGGRGSAARPAGLPFRRGGRARGASSSAPTAGAVMSAPAVTVHPEQRVADAARLMERRRVDRLPVVDEEDRLIGIVTRRDLLRVFLRSDEEIGAEVANLVLAAVPPALRDGIRVRVREGVARLECPPAPGWDTTALARAVWRVDGVIGVMWDRSTRAVPPVPC